MRTSIKSGAARAVSVTRLLLGHFDMMPVIIALVPHSEKELLNKVRRQRTSFARQTNLDQVTFDRLACEVAAAASVGKRLQELICKIRATHQQSAKDLWRRKEEKRKNMRVWSENKKTKNWHMELKWATDGRGEKVEG